MINIAVTKWGDTPETKDIFLFRMKNSSGASIEVTNLGASWVSAFLPDAKGYLGNTLLGYDTAEEYVRDTFYLGATVGRFANRIDNAAFDIEGVTYQLDKNDGENSNHGGYSGFNKKVWQWEQLESGIRFTLHSPDGEGGYPGNVKVTVEYLFSESNELTINYYGITDRDTYLNLTNHAYFNLSGEKENIGDHKLQIPSTRILDTTPEFIPTGEFTEVSGTPFDFTTERSIGLHLYDDNKQLHQNKGYNHCYVLKDEANDKLQRAAVLYHPSSGRELTVTTDLPGVLLYTAGYLLPTPDIAVCLETQYFPDTPSHPFFPSCLLTPGKEYFHRTIYTFGVR